MKTIEHMLMIIQYQKDKTFLAEDYKRELAVADKQNDAKQWILLMNELRELTK